MNFENKKSMKMVADKILELVEIARSAGLLSLGESTPKFKFDDLVNLNDIAIQELMKEFHQSDLIVILKTSSTEIAEKFYSNMSKRRRECNRSEAECLPDVIPEDIADSQREVVRIIERLSDEGVIDL